MFENNLTQEKLSSADEVAQFLQNCGVIEQASKLFEVATIREIIESDRAIDSLEVETW